MNICTIGTMSQHGCSDMLWNDQQCSIAPACYPLESNRSFPHNHCRHHQWIFERVVCFVPIENMYFTAPSQRCVKRTYWSSPQHYVSDPQEYHAYNKNRTPTWNQDHRSRTGVDRCGRVGCRRARARARCGRGSFSLRHRARLSGAWDY